VLCHAGAAEACPSGRAAVGLAVVTMHVVAAVAGGAVVVDLSVCWPLASFAVAAAARGARLDLEHMVLLPRPSTRQVIRSLVRTDAPIAVVAHGNETVVLGVV